MIKEDLEHDTALRFFHSLELIKHLTYLSDHGLNGPNIPECESDWDNFTPLLVPSRNIESFSDFSDKDVKTWILTSETLDVIESDQIFLVLDFIDSQPMRALTFGFTFKEDREWLRFLATSMRLSISSSPQADISSVITMELEGHDFRNVIQQWLLSSHPSESHMGIQNEIYFDEKDLYSCTSDLEFIEEQKAYKNLENRLPKPSLVYVFGCPSIKSYITSHLPALVRPHNGILALHHFSGVQFYVDEDPDTEGQDISIMEELIRKKHTRCYTIMAVLFGTMSLMSVKGDPDATKDSVIIAVWEYPLAEKAKQELERDDDSGSKNSEFPNQPVKKWWRFW